MDAVRFYFSFRSPFAWFAFHLAPRAQRDVDWMPPHAMWLYASERGAGERLGAEVYAARFSRGLDMSSADVYASAAQAAGPERIRVYHSSAPGFLETARRRPEGWPSV